MSGDVLNLFQVHAGSDITKRLNALNIERDVLARQKVCLCNLFTIRKVDDRQSPPGPLRLRHHGVDHWLQIPRLHQFGSARAPEDHDKFLICQVPCHTEGDTSLRNDSLAQMKYDDKRK